MTIELETKKENEKLFRRSVESLSNALEAKEKYTVGHSERVAYFSTKLAQGTGLSEREIDIICRGAKVHDIGKIGIPDNILNKKEKLTEEEYEIIKAHTIVGAKILEPIDIFKEYIPIIQFHHERIDGKGYPLGLKENEIPLNAKIVQISDCFDAMVRDRPYRIKMDIQKAIKELLKNKDLQFDPYLADIFIDMIKKAKIQVI